MKLPINLWSNETGFMRFYYDTDQNIAYNIDGTKIVLREEIKNQLINTFLVEHKQHREFVATVPEEIREKIEKRRRQ